MTTFSYIKNRIAIISSAALLALLLLLFGRSGSSHSAQQASPNTVEVPQVAAPALPGKSIPNVSMGHTKAAAPSSGGECKITPMALPLFPLEGDTISLSKSLSLAPEDAKLADLLKTANPEKSPKFEQVSAYHLAGRVLLYRALYLMDFARTGTKKPLTIPDGSDFVIPEDKIKAKALALDDAARAVALLSATRPHPKYSHWSEALYLNAQGFNMLHKYDRAAHYLEIVARTRSKAAPAEYARLILAKHLFMTKKYHEAQKYLKKINSLPAYYEKVKQWYAAAITLAMNATGDVTTLIEGVAPFAAQKERMRALVRLLAERTIDNPKPLPRVAEILKHLDASMRRPFLNWSWQLVNKSTLVQRKALATALCKLLQDLKK